MYHCNPESNNLSRLSKLHPRPQATRRNAPRRTSEDARERHGGEDDRGDDENHILRGRKMLASQPHGVVRQRSEGEAHLEQDVGSERIAVALAVLGGEDL